MNISKNVSVTSSTLAALGGITVIAHTPSFGIIAHADETHAQDTEKDPSVGDNNVQDSTQVSTIDDAYNDIKGDMEYDTNPSQHISIPFEYDTPAHAAQSWEHRKDTEIEPGTENTQTDWNIATGTNGHAASDTSANVTGDSSENKFNPGNRINYLGDKSSSVRENWVQIEKITRYMMISLMDTGRIGDLYIGHGIVEDIILTPQLLVLLLLIITTITIMTTAIMTM